MDEGANPKVPGEEKHDREGVDVAVVHAQSLLVDDARAVLLFVAERNNSLKRDRFNVIERFMRRTFTFMARGGNVALSGCKIGWQN